MERGYNQDERERFRGVIQLLGETGFERVRAARFVVVGLGGVGSWVAEGLARSGASSLVLWDLDDICVNNMNRQIHAVDCTVGQLKAEAMRERILSFHPQCAVDIVADFYTRDTVALLSRYAEGDGLQTLPLLVVVDAIDSLANKATLVAQCLREGYGVVTCGAAGGRRNPGALRVGTLGTSHSDPILRELRRRLRKDWELRAEDYDGVAAVFSTETSAVDASALSCSTDEVVRVSEAGGSKVRVARMDCAGGLGSVVYVTATMGLLAVERALALAVSQQQAVP